MVAARSAFHARDAQARAGCNQAGSGVAPSPPLLSSSRGAQQQWPMQTRCPGPGRAQAPGRSVVQHLPCSIPLEKSYDFGTLSVGPGPSWTSPCWERGCAHPSAPWALTKSRSAIAAASTRVGADGGAPARAGLGPVGSGLHSMHSGCAVPSSARVAYRRPKSSIVVAGLLAAPTCMGPGSEAGSALRERQRAFTRVVWQ